jgi:glucokinase-like ROK family protein
MKAVKKKETDQEKIKGSHLNTKRTILTTQIINIIYKDGLKTIAELCEETHNSIPSITHIMNEQTEAGLLMSFGIGESKGGRKPVLFGLNKKAGYVVSIEVSRKYTHIAIFDLHNEQIGKTHEIKQGLDNAEDIFKILKEECNAHIARQDINSDLILGYGITVPGLIDIKKGMSLSYLQFGNQPIEKSFREIFKKPVFIEHDTRAMAWGEAWFGLAKNKENVLFINIGSGIGLGIIINGQLYHGNSGLCGEFGHIQMNPDGELCYCGKIGCLETIASGAAMVKKSQEKIRNGKSTILKTIVNNDIEAITLKNIIDAANNGDLFAIELIEEAGEYLAKAMSILIHLFNPEAIIIGGEISDAGNLITDPVQQKLNKYAMQRLKQDTTILLSELKEKAGLMGILPIVVKNTIGKN